MLKKQNSKNNQLGISLIEILVSMTVSLLVLAGVVQVYVTANQNASTVNGSSAIQENARLLFSRLEVDVSRAGYAGCMNFSVNTNRIKSIVNQPSVPAINPQQFITGLNDVIHNGKSFDEFTVGYAGVDGRIPVKKVTVDSFEVASTQSNQFNQGDVVVVGDCSSFGVFRVSNSPADSGIIQFAEGVYNSGPFSISFLGENSLTPTVTYLYSGTGAFRYYIATSAAGIAAATTCSAARTEYCALFRKSSSSDQADELFDGVGAFEIEYGWKEVTTGNLFFANATNVPANKWASIDRLKISTTLRSPQKAATNEGTDYIERQFTRQFFFFNQAPEA